MQYIEMKLKHQKEFNNFPMFFAFSDKQFIDGAEETFGLKTQEEYNTQLCSIGYGGYILVKDTEAFKEMMEKHNSEMREAFKNLKFLQDAFEYELANHEYCITYDPTDALNALGFTVDDVWNDEKLYLTFKRAESNYLRNVEDF